MSHGRHDKLRSLTFTRAGHDDSSALAVAAYEIHNHNLCTSVILAFVYVDASTAASSRKLVQHMPL